MDPLFGSPVQQVAAAGGGLKEAWKLWCKMTSRPKQLTPDKNFSKGYKKALSDNKTHDYVLSVVRAAAFLPPRPRDPRDTKRFTMALSRPAWVLQGQNLEKSDVEPIPFPDGAATTMLPSELSDLCGTEWESWSTSEMEYAAMLCELDKDLVTKAVTVTQERNGSLEVLPSDVIRKKAVWSRNDVTPVRMAGRNVHGRADSERGELSGEFLDVDSIATRMYIRGVNMDEVLKFHHLAPEGFWADVQKLCNDGLGLKEATSQMEEKYMWDSRRV